MGRISDEDVARIRDATDIVALVSETTPLKQKGRLFWGLCPFHGEKTASFKVDPATQLWHCFGCGLGGDAFGFVMRSQNLDFPDAVRLLADRARIEIVEDGGTGMPKGQRERLTAACEIAAEFFHGQLTSVKAPDPEAARAYLQKRGFGSQVAKRWKLGFAPSVRGALAKHLASAGFARDEVVAANLAMAGERGDLRDRFYGRIMFPIADLQGRIIAFGGRVVGAGEPKYLNSSDTPIFHKSANMYAIDRAKSEIVSSGTAIVVEGYTDVIALHEAGIRNAVATLGTALTAQHVKLLGRFAKRIVYLFDGDEAGMRAADRAAEFIDFTSTPEAGRARLDLLVAVIPAGKDPADYVGSEGAEAMRALVAGAQPLLRFVIDRLLAAHDLATPEGRSQALTKAAGVLASLRGSILGPEYARYVADRLSAAGQGEVVTAEAVMGVAHSARPSLGGRAEAAEEATIQAACPPKRRTDPRSKMEDELLREMVAAPRLRERVRDLLSMEGAVSDPMTARLVAAVLDAGTATGGALYDVVAAVDREAAEALSAYLVDPPTPERAAERFAETSRRLAEFALKEEIGRLQAEMRGTDPTKDSARYDELFRMVAELQHELSEVHTASAADVD
jgi:DNA primase